MARRSTSDAPPTAADPIPQVIAMISLFANKFVSDPDSAITLDDNPDNWSRLLDNPERVDDDDGKESASVITGARYFPGSPSRAKENIEHVECLILDVDATPVPESDLLAALDGVRAIVYASPSHTAASPRWRVLLPLATPLPPKKHRDLVAKLSEGLVPGHPGCIDVESTGDPGRLGFVGVTKHPSDYVWHNLPGRRLDWTGLDLSDEAEGPPDALGGLERSPLWTNRQRAVKAALRRYKDSGLGMSKGRSDLLWRTAMALWWDWAAEDEDFVLTVLRHVNANFVTPEDDSELLRAAQNGHERTIGNRRIGQKRGTYGFQREPTGIVTRQAIAEYARKLKRRSSPDALTLGEALLRLSKGETLADDPQAWAGLTTRCCQELARAFPLEQPERLVEHFRPALATMRHAGLTSVPSEEQVEAFVRTSLLSVQRDREEREARQEHARERAIEMSTRGERSTAYTTQEIEAWRNTVGFDDNNWIIVSGKAFYVFCNGAWKGPYNDVEFEASGRKDLYAAEQAGLVQLYRIGDDGERKAIPLTTLLQWYGRQANTRIEMWTDKSYFSPDDETLVLSGPERVKREPRYHADVDAFLRALAGRDPKPNKVEAGQSNNVDDFDIVCDWLASLVETQYPLAALYLEGETNHGKGLFAAGVAKLWRAGFITMEDAFHKNGFNSMLAESPLVWVDENFPQGMNPSDILRRGLSQREHTYTRKHKDSGKLFGCVRVLITANHPTAIDRGERLTKEDHDAVGTRYAHVKVRSAAKTFLESIGAARVASFVEAGLIAEHVLWLHEKRFPAVQRRGARFLVEPKNTNLAHLMVANRPEASAVLTAVVHAVTDKRKADWYRISEGSVWLNSVDAVAQARLVDPALRVTEREMVRVMRAMSTGRRKVLRAGGVDKVKKCWELDNEVIKAWCETTMVADWVDISVALCATVPAADAGATVQ